VCVMEEQGGQKCGLDSLLVLTRAGRREDGGAELAGAVFLACTRVCFSRALWQVD